MLFYWCLWNFFLVRWSIVSFAERERVVSYINIHFSLKLLCYGCITEKAFSLRTYNISLHLYWTINFEGTFIAYNTCLKTTPLLSYCLLICVGWLFLWRTQTSGLSNLALHSSLKMAEKSAFMYIFTHHSFYLWSFVIVWLLSCLLPMYHFFSIYIHNTSFEYLLANSFF